MFFLNGFGGTLLQIAATVSQEKVYVWLSNVCSYDS
jgi:hypothetical protein